MFLNQNSHHVRYTVAVVVLSVLLFACNLETETETTAELPVEPKSTNWYLCTEEGISPSSIEEIQANDGQNIKPWVESFCITGTWTNKNSVNFLINRWGVADFSAKKGFSKNAEANPAFSTVTSSDVFLVNNIPYFKQYRDSFFQTETANEHPAIMKWKTASKTGEPVIYPKDFGISNNFEATNSFIKNNELFLTLKSSSKTKTEFEYTKLPLTSLNEFSKNYSSISAGTYRNESSPLPFNKIPERFADLVKQFDEISFSLSYRDETQEICTQQNFVVGSEPKLTAYGLSTKTQDVLLFEDGTLLIKVLDSENNPQFYKAKLPRPTNNLVYTGLALKDSYLFGIWEEQFFFNRGKCGLYAGFLEI